MAIKRAAADPTRTSVPRRAASVVTAFAMIAAGLGIAAGLQLASPASGTTCPAIAPAVTLVLMRATGWGQGR